MTMTDFGLHLSLQESVASILAFNAPE